VLGAIQLVVGNVQLKGGEDYVREAEQVYSGLIGKSLEPARSALEKTFASEGGIQETTGN